MSALSQTQLKIYMAFAAAEQIQESVLPLYCTWNFFLNYYFDFYFMFKIS